MTDFYIVDVFTQGRFTGNPLAVFLDGQRYTSTEMQQLARELNFSETTFIFPPTAGGIWPIRIFTPVAELPFAGHPTLGSAFVIAGKLQGNRPPSLTLEMPVGRIEVTLLYTNDRIDRLTMRQPAPTFGQIYPYDEVVHALGLAKSMSDQSMPPVQMVSTGLPFLIVPLPDLHSVRVARLLLNRLEAIAGMDPQTNVLVYTHEAEDASHDLHVRVFVPELGISEDPATGSANGCLCAYLLRYANGTHDKNAHLTAIAEQGYEIGRPSLLHLSGSRIQDAYEIHVGGTVEWVVQATLYDGKKE